MVTPGLLGVMLFRIVYIIKHAQPTRCDPLSWEMDDRDKYYTTFQSHLCNESSTLISACGFGMRVMGGRRNTKGTLGAFVTMVVPDGPADTQGIQIGNV